MRKEHKADMMDVMPTTAEKLRRIRRGSGLTQQELAAKTGLSQSTIAMIENGTRKTPRPSTLTKLAEALGVSPFELLED